MRVKGSFNKCIGWIGKLIGEVCVYRVYLGILHSSVIQIPGFPVGYDNYMTGNFT